VKDRSRFRLLRTSLTALAVAAAIGAGPALGDPGGKAPGNPHLPAAPAPPPLPPGKAALQGVVQAVRPDGALIRLLDGSTVNVPLGPDTLVVLDGKSSRLTAIRPGYVLLSLAKSGHTTVARFVRTA
jgi:hypothetical protein